jgi:hypothetical protein
MTSLHGISVQGATFPSFIWKAFMLKAHGSYCGDFPTFPPFQSQPFFGHYSTGGKHDDNTSTYGTSTTPGTTTTVPQATGDGGAGAPTPNKDGTGDYNNPEIYQSPPQTTPGNGQGHGHGHGHG